MSDAWEGFNRFFGFSLAGHPEIELKMAFIYGLGISSFFVFYILIYRWLKNVEFPHPVVRLSPWGQANILAWYQVFIWMAILWNIHQSGISLVGLLNFQNQSEKEILFSIHWYSHGIDLLANSLSVALYLQFQAIRKTGVVWWMLFILWLVFCLLAGWRYRIILLALFFLFDFLRFQPRAFRRMMWILPLLFLGISWLTLNRMAIAKRQFQLVTFDLRQFDLDIFKTELSNSRTCKASLIYMKENRLESPGISSWIDFVGNKLKPKSEFPHGVRPFPWIITITKSWIPKGWPWNPNPAVTQMEEFFLTFSWPGLILGMAVFGIWVALLDIRQPKVGWGSFQIIASGLCFQWITRGFFLYQLQITIASMLPFLVLMLMNRYLPHANGQNKA